MEMKKKGIMDIFAIMAMVFGIAVITIMVTVMVLELDTGFESFVESSTVANDTWQTGVEISENFDIIVLGAFIVLIIFALILAAVIPANPVFIPVYIVIAILSIVVSVPISNFFEDFINDAAITAAATHYPMATFIFANLPIIMVAVLIMMMIVTYAKGGMSNER